MRELKGSDLFTFARMLQKMNIRGELKDLFKMNENTDIDIENEGLTAEEIIQKENENKIKREAAALSNIGFIIDGAFIVIENIHKAEKEFWAFVAPIAEKNIEEAKELSFTDLITIVKKIFSDEGFTSFFKQAS